MQIGFGTETAILGATINHHLELYEDQHPEMVNTIRSSLYVDDLVSGAQDDDEAFTIYKSARKIMAAGGFNLRKWNSNSTTLVEAINDVEKGAEISATTLKSSVTEEDTSYAKATIGQETSITGDRQLKVLGVIWNTDSDKLMFTFSELVKYARSLPLTKRSVLRLTSKIFDPVGFLSPFTVKMKALFQELCIGKADWDDELKGDLQTRWNLILTELETLDNVRIPRCYFKSTSEPTTIELHGFSDASQIAFAAVVYLRSVYEDGHIEVKLVASKTRVAPLKKQTIPRLELLGANILARLMDTVRNCLFVNQEIEMYNWTDSMTVLCWITNDKVWKQYVQHRVQEICKLTSRNSWKFCPGSKNPADLPSRGLKANELLTDTLWWDGPGFLYQPGSKWPKESTACPPDEI